jgi:CRP/FNR family cyclic AMP-dependent transcriptional regulator
MARRRVAAKRWQAPDDLTCPVVAEETRIAEVCGDLCTVRDVARGTWIYRQGDVSQSFYQLVDGGVQIYVADPDGREQVVTWVAPGGLFGEAACFGWMAYSTSAVATARSRVRVFPRDAVLERIRDHPDLAVDLLRSLARKMHLFAVQLERAAFRSASERLALLLEALAAQYGEPAAEFGGVRLHQRITHEELARMIGSTRVTVTREIARLTQAGHVRRDASGRLVLLHRRGA